MVNGIEIPLTSGLVQVVNGELVQVVNNVTYKLQNGGILVPVVNGLVPVVNSYSSTIGNNEKAVVILDLDDTAQHTTLGAMFSSNIITGLNSGVQTIVSGMVANTNFNFTYAPGHITIKKDTITIAANNITRVYGDPNPELIIVYSGFSLDKTCRRVVLRVLQLLQQRLPLQVQPELIRLQSALVLWHLLIMHSN